MGRGGGWMRRPGRAGRGAWERESGSGGMRSRAWLRCGMMVQAAEVGEIRRRGFGEGGRGVRPGR